MVCKLELLKDETEGVVWVEVKLEDEGKVAVGVANLQPTMPDQLSGATANSQDGVRLDISANGVWDGRFEKTFFDVRVFNPHAPSNRNQTPSACYRKHEREKKRAYTQTILKWSICPSLHLFFWPQEEWGERQPVSTNVWLPCSLRSGITHTAPHSAG